MENDLLFFNGVNGATGDYLLPALNASQISAIATGEQIDETLLNELKYRYRITTQEDFGLRDGPDPTKLEESGWGIIFAASIGEQQQQAIKGALRELLDHRKHQAAQNHAHYYKEYVGENAYRPDESKQDFLARNGAGPGCADPDNVPYYLLIVGDPEAIPYRFQYQLDVQYAVGRIWFDTLEEYSRYSHSVVASETEVSLRHRSMAFFGVQNPDDKATNLSANELVLPLSRKLAVRYPDWAISTAVGEQANKAKLAQLLGGDETPSLLFSASHGMGFPNGDLRQRNHQGALLCQDWPGPVNWRDPISEDFYFSADDVAAGANVSGLIAFHFACFGAGTPRLDDFAHQALHAPIELAPHSFIARLPCRLLTQESGGALAIVGHVERAWGYSFMWGQAGRQIQTFEDALRRLVDGHPVGSAMEPFNQRYSELASDLSVELEDIKFGRKYDPFSIAGMWTANNDARSYVIIGDPAVRMPAGLRNDENDKRSGAARSGT